MAFCGTFRRLQTSIFGMIIHLSATKIRSSEMKNFVIKNGIYHHVSGSFRLRERKGRNVEVQFTSRPGKWESTGSKDLYEATEYAETRLLNRGASIFSTKAVMTFGDFAKRFFLRYDENSYRRRLESFGKNYGEAFYTSNQSRLDNYIMPALKDCPISMITSRDAEKVYLNCKSVHKDTLSDNTRNKIRQTMVYIFDDAVRKSLIERSPMEGTGHIVEKAERREVFSVYEMRKLFPEDRAELKRVWGNSTSRSDGSYILWATYFSIMYDTGFRPGEVSALSKDCFRGNGVYTRKSVDGVTRELKNSIKTTSKGQPFKVGILSEYTLSLVKELSGATADDYLFKINGDWMLCNTANKHLKESLIRAGIDPKGRTQYCFRHSFDTNMLNSINDDMKAKDVQLLMGHTSYRREYDHRTEDNIISALDGKVKDIIDNIRNA